MKNKIIFFIITLIFICLNINAQSPNWLWAKNGNASNAADASPVATDNSGNVYLAGWFNTGTLTFSTTTLNWGSTGNIFIVKYNSSGGLLNVINPIGYGMPYAITTDATGNVYTTGYFNSSTIIFGSYTLTNASSGAEDFFIVKYNPSGNVLWAKRAGGTGSNDEGCGLSCDGSGNVFVTGTYDSPTITFGSFTLTKGGSRDLFIVKYDINGNALWAKGAGGICGNYGYGVSTDNSGNVYMTGQFNCGTITFGSFSLTGSGVLLVKYDPMGNELWAKGAPGNINGGYSCATDQLNNIYVTGHFGTATIVFGSYTLTNTYPGKDDIFLVKYNSFGNVIWAKAGGGNDYDIGYSVATNPAGNIYLSGTYGWGGAVDTLIFGMQILYPPTPGYYAGFLMKFDSLGNVLCATSIATAGDDNNSVAVDPLGDNVYLGCDLFSGNSFNFGPDTINGTGIEYPVVAKWNCSLNTGLNEVPSSQDITFSIYPNPFSSETTLRTNTVVKNGILCLYNSLNQEIKTVKIISGNEIKLQRDDLPAGIYFVRLTEDNKSIASGKLVIYE